MGLYVVCELKKSPRNSALGSGVLGWSMELLVAAGVKEVVSQPTLDDSTDFIQTASLPDRMPGTDFGQLRHHFYKLIDQHAGQSIEFHRVAFFGD